MSKRPNYYQVHKNKTPKSLKYISTDKIAECIVFATKIINNAIERAQLIMKNSQPIPKYELGGTLNKNTFALVGENNQEFIVDSNGRTQSVPDFVNQSVDHFDTELKIRKHHTSDDLVEASKRLQNLYPTFHVAANSFNDFAKAYQKALEKGLLKNIIKKASIIRGFFILQ